MARFKHISERCRTDASGTIVKEYIVQVYGTTHGGRHASLDAAKKTLRKVAAKKTQWLGGERGRCTKNNDNKWVLAPFVRVMARKKKNIKERQVSHTVGLSFHTGIQRWVGNQIPLGATFETEAEGRAALCKKRAALCRVSHAKQQKRSKRKRIAASIELKSQGACKKEATQSSTSPIRTLQRVQKLVLWGERGRRCSGKAGFKKKNFPADLWSSLAHCEKSKAMYKKFPITRLLSLQSKYGHAKDALLKAWIHKV